MRATIVVILYFLVIAGVHSLIESAARGADTAERVGAVGAGLAITLLLLALAERIAKGGRKKPALPATGQIPGQPVPADPVAAGGNAPADSPADPPPALAVDQAPPAPPVAASVQPPRTAARSIAGTCGLLLMAATALVCSYLVNMDPALRSLSPVIVVLFFVLRFAILPRARTAAKVGGFLALAAVVVAGGVAGKLHQKRQWTQIANDLREQYARVTETAPDGLPRVVSVPPDAAPRQSGTAGQMERFMKQLMRRVILLRNEYISQLTAIGWTNLLSADRLKDDADLAESRKMLQATRRALQTFRTGFDELPDQVRSDIDELVVDPQTRSTVRHGFERSLTQNLSNITRMLTLEEKCLLEAEKMIDLLAASQGKWTVQDHQLMFTSPQDRKAFNESLETMERYSQQEDKIQQEASQRTQANLRAIAGDQ